MSSAASRKVSGSASRHARRIASRGERGEIHGHHRRLRVDRHREIERARLERMAHGREPTAQRFAQRLGRMQDVATAHHRREPAERPLFRLRDLLHVVAFAVRRLVAVDVIDADSVRGCRERAGEGLKRAGTDGGDDGGDLPILPGELGRGVRHGHFVAKLPGAGHAGLLVDPERLCERGVAVAEDRKVLAHALLQQAQHKRLDQRHGDDLRERARG